LSTSTCSAEWSSSASCCSKASDRFLVNVVSSTRSEWDRNAARSLKTRSDQRLRSMQALLRDRCEEEVRGIEAVLAELETSIRGALSETDRWVQPSLFEIDEGERDQLRTDHEALRIRLDAIPEQREREIEALRRRYADPTTRWFPVAVTLLVPSSIAREAGR